MTNSRMNQPWGESVKKFSVSLTGEEWAIVQAALTHYAVALGQHGGSVGNRPIELASQIAAAVSPERLNPEMWAES